MKILNISSSSGIGGREMLVMTLSLGLREKNNDVRLITTPNTWLNDEVTKNGFYNYSLPMKKYIDFYSIYQMGKILKDFQPDVVHLYFISDIWLVIPAVKLFFPKAKVFLLRSMLSAPMKDWTRTKLFAGLDKIITMSDFITADFLSKTKVPQNKVETIYIGVDPEKFQPTISDNQSILKQDYNLPDDSLLVGLVGRIDLGKGQNKFIEAAKQICEKLAKENQLEKLNKLKFFIVGSAEKGAGEEYVKNLKKRVLELNLTDKIIFTGFRNDVPEVMKSLDIAVFPSENEAFGLVVIEAMAANRAVVGFRRGAFPEIIVDGETGLTTDYNYEALGAGIYKLIINDELRQKFAEKGQKRVVAKFSLSETLAKFMALYRSYL